MSEMEFKSGNEASTHYLFEQETFDGHRNSVNILKIRKVSENVLSGLHQGSVLATGSDDGTVRIWNPDTRRCIKCFRSPLLADGVDLIDFYPQNESIVFASAGNRIVSLDLSTANMVENGVISTFESSLVKGEINSFTIHPTKQLLAFSDDSYILYLLCFSSAGVFEFSAPETIQSFRPFHSNVVYSLLFTTHLKRDEIYLGGFDFELSYWEIGRRNRPSKSVKMNIHDEYHTETQTLNPPFIYTISLACKDKALIVGLGDGSIRLYHSAQLTLFSQKTVHFGAITSVKVLGNYIVSAGVDQWLYCHEIITISKSRAPVQYELQFRWSVQHSDKINSIDGWLHAESNRIQLFVSDITSKLHYYQIYPQS